MDIKDAYKFCPRCGQAGTQQKNHLQCPACGLSTYFSPKSVTEIVLQNDNGEYLFTVRGVEPNKGMIDFPGGFVEDGEDFEQAVRRELKEELGIEVEEIETLGTSSDKYMFQDINYTVIGVSYFAKLPADAVLKPNDDVAGFEFYKLTDVPFDKLSGRSARVAIQKLAEREAKKTKS